MYVGGKGVQVFNYLFLVWNRVEANDHVSPSTVHPLAVLRRGACEDHELGYFSSSTHE